MKHKENGTHRKFLLLYAGVLLVLIIGVVILTIRLVDEKAQVPSSQPRASTPTPNPIGTMQPLFSDTFLDNSKGWSVVNVPGYMRTLHTGTLTLSDTNHNVLVESIPTSTTFTNFSLTTTFTLVQGDENDSVGLYLRGDSNLDHDYRVDIFGNNTYAISKETLSANSELEQTFLVPPTQTKLLNPIGRKNMLAVALHGPTMVVQMNGQTLSSLTDTGYIHGQIALFVANGMTSNGVTAQFHDLVIYPTPK